MLARMEVHYSLENTPLVISQMIVIEEVYCSKLSGSKIQNSSTEL